MTDQHRDGPYEVGYGKPPKDSQFRPGQSGNPKGRPKSARNLRTDVMEALRMPVVVTENGKRKRISTQGLSLRVLVQKALRGDVRALGRLLELAARYNDEPPPTPADQPLSADDEKILADFLERHAHGAGDAADQQVGGASGEGVDGSTVTEPPPNAASRAPDGPSSSEASDDDKPDDPPAGDAPDREGS